MAFLNIIEKGLLSILEAYVITQFDEEKSEKLEQSKRSDPNLGTKYLQYQYVHFAVDNDITNQSQTTRSF